MSRHTILAGTLSRCIADTAPGALFGDYELVAYMEPGGTVRLVAEPKNRRIARNEILPTVIVDLVAEFEAGCTTPADDPPEEDDCQDTGGVPRALKAGIDRVCSRIAIRAGEDAKLLYAAKSILLDEIKREFSKHGNVR